MQKKQFYITTPIYYPSGKPHIGHAYSTILADVICRYKALIGYDAFLQTGMDEHGQKIAEAAEKAGKKPQEFVNDISKIFLKLWKDLDINYSSFIRTSEPRHVKVVQEVFADFQKAGYIYLGEWEGLYCVSCEENYTKTQAIIDKSGSLTCRVGHKLTTKKEESYFFKMSQFQGWIKQLYEQNPSFITPKARVNELTNSFLDEGLQDLSVSRTSIEWGIPVLENPKHKIYVWIDALLNYLTGLGYKQKDDTLFQKYWNNTDGEVVHIMSKEITRFHCIYWPIMLNCLKLRQATKVISHGWIITDQGKMSKSLGNVIDPNEYISNFGSDALRYYLMKEMSVERDGIFAHDLFIECYNADLANTYGNLVSRFLGMASKHNNGIIKKGNVPMDNLSIELENAGRELITAVEDCIQSYKIDEVIHNILDFAKLANKYVEETKPWTLVKDNKLEHLNNFLFCLGNAIRILTSLLQPILTSGTQEMIKQLKLTKSLLEFHSLNNYELLDNHKIGSSTPIYNRIEVKK
ncbi:MAG: methionine--tRNA ligase [Mycoplasmataceae bacterium]|nr:methionine--tRNA ligase [Mycoplasmataceae bacterium]